MTTKDKIISKCRELESLLLEKNQKYGDAALDPMNVFSKANAVTGIKVRIDDKLKRIKNAGLVEDTEDTLKDLAGYFILLMIAKENESHNIQEHIRQRESSSYQSTTSTGENPEWSIEHID
jgi:hypothetical protein